MTLSSHVDNFRYAVALFDEISRLPRDRDTVVRVNNWRFIPARDAVLTVHQFSMTLQSLNSSLGQCKTIRDLINRDEMRLANKLCAASFPRIADIRLNVAHNSEFRLNANAFEEHSAQGEDWDGPGFEGKGMVSLSNALINDIYTATVKGKFASLAINENTALSLEAVCTHVELAFEPVTAFARAQRLQPRPQNGV